MSISDFDSKVCTALVDCVSEKPSTENTRENTYEITYGDDLYPDFRKCLNMRTASGAQIDLVEGEIQPAKKNKAKLSTKEQIVMKNLAEKMNEKFKIFKVSISNSYVISRNGTTSVGDFILRNDNIDIRAAGFLYLCWFGLQKETSVKFSFGVIVSTQRFLKAIKNKKFNSAVNSSIQVEVSTHLIADMQRALAKLITRTNFRGDTLYRIDPSLILEAPWDKYAPNQHVKAFPHQKLLSDLILNIGKTPTSELVALAKEAGSDIGDVEAAIDAFFVPVCVLTNAGKTTAIVNVAVAARTILPRYPTIRVIAVCAIENIRRRWSALLSHCEIPYFCHDDYIDSCQRRNQNPSKTEIMSQMKTSIVNIFPPEYALEFLERLPNSILFYDEPTMYADCKKENAKLFVKLMNGVAVLKCMPRFTFLCSATLDTSRDEFYQLHKAKFQTSRCINVYSKKIYGYANVLTNDGIVVAPHMGCKNKAELNRVIECIERTPLLGKFYSPTVVMDLYEATIEATSIEYATKHNVPNVPEIFGDVDNLSPNTVKETAIEILKKVVQMKDDQISDICEPTEYEDFVIKYDRIGTSDAHKFQHTNLVATIEPVDFTRKNFAKIHTEIKDAIGSYDKLLAPYNAWIAGRKKLEESIKNPAELAEELENYDTSKPKCYIPERYQINTPSHIARYTKYQHNERARIPITEIMDLGNVPEDIDYITHAGVGVFNPDTLPKRYTNVLMGTKESGSGLVTEGRLEFLVSNNEIAYGTDCPFGGLFVDATLLENGMSINTLFQLISRIGRGRKSPYANVYLHPAVSTFLSEFIKGEVKDTEYETILEIMSSLRPIEEIINDLSLSKLVKIVKKSKVKLF